MASVCASQSNEYSALPVCVWYSAPFGSFDHAAWCVYEGNQGWFTFRALSARRTVPPRLVRGYFSQGHAIAALAKCALPSTCASSVISAPGRCASVNHANTSCQHQPRARFSHAESIKRSSQAKPARGTNRYLGPRGGAMHAHGQLGGSALPSEVGRQGGHQHHASILHAHPHLQLLRLACAALCRLCPNRNRYTISCSRQVTFKRCISQRGHPLYTTCQPAQERRPPPKS